MRKALILLLISIAAFGQDCIPVGQEFCVDEILSERNRYPSVCGLNNGGFVVCWVNRDEKVYMKIFNEGGRATSEAITISSDGAFNQKVWP